MWREKFVSQVTGAVPPTANAQPAQPAQPAAAPAAPAPVPAPAPAPAPAPNPVFQLNQAGQAKFAALDENARQDLRAELSNPRGFTRLSGIDLQGVMDMDANASKALIDACKHFDRTARWGAPRSDAEAEHLTDRFFPRDFIPIYSNTTNYSHHTPMNAIYSQRETVKEAFKQGLSTPVPAGVSEDDAMRLIESRRHNQDGRDMGIAFRASGLGALVKVMEEYGTTTTTDYTLAGREPDRTQTQTQTQNQDAGQTASSSAPKPGRH